MGAALYSVECLVQQKFPDALFDRLCRLLGPDDRIELIPDPRKLNLDGGPVEHPRELEGHGSQAANEHLSQPRRSKRLREKLASAKPPTLQDTILGALSKGRKSLYDPSRNRWKRWPKANKPNQESAMADYLNTLVDRACQFLDKKRSAAGLEKLRPGRFSSNHAKTPFRSKGSARKPDISLTHPDDVEGNSWKPIRGLGTLKSEAEFSKSEATEDFAELVRLIFGNQRGRRFVLCFRILDAMMRLWKFDRSGVLVSQAFDVHSSPKEFLRVILGMALGDDYYLGYDPSFFHRDGQDWIKLNGKEYRVIDEIQLNADILGRGTVVLLAEDEKGKRVVVKDQWVGRSQEGNEFEMLEILNEGSVRGVPRLIDYQLVHFKVGTEGSIVDSTETDRDSEEMREKCKLQDVEIRDHYRLLISPYGDKLESFCSLKELVSAFRDYVKVIEELYEMDIVHRDISPGNVILVRLVESLRKGYLIDFDHAVKQSRTCPAESERTGTFPFMAIEVLMNPRVVRKYYHDLESLFYVLIWTCLTLEGPNNQERSPADLDIHAAPLNRMCYRLRDDDSEIVMLFNADVKTAMMATKKFFFDKIIPHLPEYFKPLEDLLFDLREVLFDNGPRELGKAVAQEEPKYIKDRNPESVFKQIYDIFEHHLAALPDESIPGIEKREAANSITLDSDSGICMVPSPITPYGDMLLPTRMASKQGGIDALNSTNTTGSPCLHGQDVLNAAGSKRLRGTKRSHDCEQVEQSGSIPSSSSSKRSRRREKL